MSTNTGVTQPRLLLPIALALAVIRGSSMPWVTIRTFGGDQRNYDLTDIKGGVAIVVTITFVVMIGVIVGVFKRLTGMTIMSLGVAALGWMAAISGMLLTLLWSLIPSVNVAGLDLARATLSQGSGVVVTVVSSLALAFMVVRQLEPVRSYAPSTHIAALPIVILLPIIAIAVGMHSEWLQLGSDDASVQVLIAGDALYGSGLVVLGLWLSVGLWIGALMINRRLVIMVACGLTFLIAVIVEMYALLVWAGGNALDWLVPAKLERWTTVSMEPQLFLVLIASGLVALMSILGFVPRIQRMQISLGTRVKSTSGLWYSDVVGGLVLVLVIASFVLGLV